MNWFNLLAISLPIGAFVLLGISCFIGKFLGFNDDHDYSDQEPAEDTRDWQGQFERDQRR
jgi:hypothetical protein